MPRRVVRPRRGAWLLVEHHDRIDFHLRALGQRGDLDGGARRIRLLEVFGHYRVDGGEIGQVGDVDAHAHELRERSTGSLGHCGEVVEYAPCLRTDVAFDQVTAGRIQRD